MFNVYVTWIIDHLATQEIETQEIFFPSTVNIKIFLCLNGLHDEYSVIELVYSAPTTITNFRHLAIVETFARETLQGGKHGEISRIISEDGALCFWSRIGEDPECRATKSWQSIAFLFRHLFVQSERASCPVGSPGYTVLPPTQVSRFSHGTAEETGIGIFRSGVWVSWTGDVEADRRAETANRSIRKDHRDRLRETERGRKVSSREETIIRWKLICSCFHEVGKLRQDFACQREESRCFQPFAWVGSSPREKLPNFSTSPSLMTPQKPSCLAGFFDKNST